MSTRILIPTDFSKLSKVAVFYAIELAQKLQGELIVVSVVNTEIPPMTTLGLYRIRAAFKKSTEQEMILLIKEIEKKYKSYKKNITHKILFGSSVSETIERFASRNNIDLIVVGTKGATGLKKVFLGSNATSIINKSTIPVITVPEFTKFKGLQNIVYATNMLDLNEEIEIIFPFSQLFEACIHVLHITSPDSTQKNNPEKITDELKNTLKGIKIEFHSSTNENISEGIENFIAKINADMLVMFTHELSFYEKIAGKSVTREVALGTKIPMLIFNKSNFE